MPTQNPDSRNVAIREAADTLAEKSNSDIIFYNGPIQRPYDGNLIEACASMPRRKNVTLLLVTEGGDPDAAYRISRTLQSSYERFTCLVSGYCKSAGTIVAIGAHEIVFGFQGELGPVDVQMSKRDELFEMQSGQTVMSALETLQTRAFLAFEHYFMALQQKSSGRVTLKTASELACRLSVGLFSPIYQQIDPMHIGEAGRASSIALQYGTRLDKLSKNLRPRALEYLMSGYTSHGFVIDEGEAMELFRNVRHVNEIEAALCAAMNQECYIPSGDKTSLAFLSSPLQGVKANAEPKPNGSDVNTQSKPRKAPAAPSAGA